MLLCVHVLARGCENVHAYVCVCVFVWVGVGVRARVCARARVASLIQHSARRHIVICSVSGPTILCNIISYTARFSEKSYWIKNVYFDFLHKFI